MHQDFRRQICGNNTLFTFTSYDTGELYTLCYRNTASGGPKDTIVGSDNTTANYVQAIGVLPWLCVGFSTHSLWFSPK
jgi:hypothetical protein